MKKKFFFFAVFLGLIAVLLLLQNTFQKASVLDLSFEETSQDRAIFVRAIQEVLSEKNREKSQEKANTLFQKFSEYKGYSSFQNLLQRYPLKTDIEVFPFEEKNFFLSFLGVPENSTRLVEEYVSFENSTFYIAPQGKITQKNISDSLYINTSQVSFPLDGEFLSLPSDTEVMVSSLSGKTFIAPGEEFSVVSTGENTPIPFSALENLKYGYILSVEKGE